MAEPVTKPAHLGWDLGMLLLCAGLEAVGHYGGIQRLADARHPEIFQAYVYEANLLAVTLGLTVACAGAVAVRLCLKWKTTAAWAGIVRCGIIVVIAADFFWVPSWGRTCQPRFMARFEAKAREKGVIPAIRAWARSLEVSEDGGYDLPDRPDKPWPACVKAFNVDRVSYLKDIHGVGLGWSGPIGRYGLVVGKEDMEIPPAKKGERIIRLDAGAYLYAMP